MPIYKCSFKGDKKVKKIRVALNRTECLLGLTYEGVTNPKVSELVDLHGLEYILFGDVSLNKLKSTSICDFFEQISFLLKAGMPLYSALETLGKSGDKYIKSLCIKIVPSIIEGISFDEALNKTGLFSVETVHQIRAGTESGDLANSLDRVAKNLRKQIELKNKSITAAVYPLFMLIVLIGVTTLMMTSIIPQISQSFTDLGGELPAITLFVIAVSNGFVKYMPSIVICLVLLFLIIKILLKRNKNFKEQFDKMILKIPLIGELNLKRNISSISTVLSSLLVCGIPIVQSLNITIETVKNEYLKRKLQKARKYVEIEGNSLYNALLQVKGFPTLFVQLIDVGEKSGDLVSVLDKLAERYDNYVENIMKRIITLLEPLVIVLMVVIGGTVVIGMMMPIFTIIEII